MEVIFIAAITIAAASAAARAATAPLLATCCTWLRCLHGARVESTANINQSSVCGSSGLLGLRDMLQLTLCSMHAAAAAVPSAGNAHRTSLSTDLNECRCSSAITAATLL
jgi:hypothetical protein